MNNEEMNILKVSFNNLLDVAHITWYLYCLYCESISRRKRIKSIKSMIMNAEYTSNYNISYRYKATLYLLYDHELT